MSELTLHEAMNKSGVCQKTIYNWCREGRFKFRREVNRRLFIEADSFEQWITRRIEELNTEKGIKDEAN